MTVEEAARMLGCSIQHVRLLIRQRRIRAKRVDGVPGGFRYNVNYRSVRAFRDRTANHKGRGRPRGPNPRKRRKPRRKK